MPIRDLITTENVLAYARAGIEVARACRRLRDHHGYRSMIVPSRGADPFIEIARSYYRGIIQPHISREDRLTVLPDMFGPLTLAFHAPFTADAGEMGVPGLETSHIRTFWARVIAAIARGDVNNPNYRLYRFVRDEICRVGHHDNFEWRIRDERLVFIDTVISGRAVAEIIDAFEAEGMTQIHYVLLLDEDGARIKPEYARRIRTLEKLGRVTQIRLPTLFTEDQGPAVSGIWSVVVPALMDQARQDPLFADGAVGAGLYYHEVSLRKDKSNLRLTQANARLHQLLFQAMHVAADPDLAAEDMDEMGVSFTDEHALEDLYRLRSIHNQDFDYCREEYIEHIEKYDLFDQASTLKFAQPRLDDGVVAGHADADVSSSHCLRLKIDETEAARLMRQFRASLAAPYWADQDCTERAV